MAEPRGNATGAATTGPEGPKISDVQKGVKTLDYVPPKKPQQPVRH